MPFTTWGNWVEAGLWLAIALVLATKAARANGRARTAFWILIASFLLFALTDAIESQTGAWWRPWWLLLLKGLCVVGFVAGFVTYYGAVRRSTAKNIKPNESN